jgi:hypothetical protein
LRYSLNTLPAKSRVLSNITVKQMSQGYRLDATQYQEILEKINAVDKKYENITTSFWTVLD